MLAELGHAGSLRVVCLGFLPGHHELLDVLTTEAIIIVIEQARDVLDHWRSNVLALLPLDLHARSTAHGVRLVGQRRRRRLSLLLTVAAQGHREDLMEKAAACRVFFMVGRCEYIGEARSAVSLSLAVPLHFKSSEERRGGLGFDLSSTRKLACCRLRLLAEGAIAALKEAFSTLAEGHAWQGALRRRLRVEGRPLDILIVVGTDHSLHAITGRSRRCIKELIS